jgi:nitrite reductase (NADH) small subunit
MARDVRTVKHPVGQLDCFQPGEIAVVSVADRSIGIINTGETLYAVLNVCPHERVPICDKGSLHGTMLPSATGEVDYGLENRILRCPWHGFEFDLADGGRCVFSTYNGRVHLLPVSVEDGQVMVEVRETRGRETPGRQMAVPSGD